MRGCVAVLLLYWRYWLLAVCCVVAMWLKAYVANYLGVRQITRVITCKTCFVNYLRNYAVKLRRNFPSYALANYLRNYVQNAQNPRNLRKLRGKLF